MAVVDHRRRERGGRAGGGRARGRGAAGARRGRAGGRGPGAEAEGGAGARARVWRRRRADMAGGLGGPGHGGGSRGSAEATSPPPPYVSPSPPPSPPRARAWAPPPPAPRPPPPRPPTLLCFCQAGWNSTLPNLVSSKILVSLSSFHPVVFCGQGSYLGAIIQSARLAGTDVLLLFSKATLSSSLPRYSPLVSPWQLEQMCRASPSSSLVATRLPPSGQPSAAGADATFAGCDQDCRQSGFVSVHASVAVFLTVIGASY